MGYPEGTAIHLGYIDFLCFFQLPFPISLGLDKAPNQRFATAILSLLDDKQN